MKKIVNSYLVKLDISSGFNNVFYVNKLHLINNNSLPNQPIDDIQPPPIQENKIKGYMMENIITEKKRKVGKELKKEYKVKWRGYTQMT